jgi:carboxymethylenebutenolidase
VSEPERISVPTDTGDMPAYLWLPEAGTGPGVVLFQEIFGVSRYIRRRAADLAGLGYVVLAPDFYWRLDPSLEPLDEGASGALEDAVGRMSSLDWERTVADGLAALVALRGRADVTVGVGVLGFCFGGGLAFNVAAVADPKPDCLVSYYGSAIPGLLHLADSVTVPSLHHFGLSDDYIDADTVEAVRKAVTAGNDAVVFETHDEANHAFDNPHFMNFHESASGNAWESTERFLAEWLPVSSR